MLILLKGSRFDGFSVCLRAKSEYRSVCSSIDLQLLFVFRVFERMKEFLEEINGKEFRAIESETANL